MEIDKRGDRRLVGIDLYNRSTRLLGEQRRAQGDCDTFQDMLNAELGTVQKSVDAIAEQVIAGMEAVIQMESPIPTEYQELVYQAARFSPGSGFNELLSEDELQEILLRLMGNRTL